MKHQVSLLLYRAGDHCAPVSEPYPPVMVLHGESESMRSGENGLFLGDGGIRITCIEMETQAISNFAAFDYEFRYFSPAQRRASDAAAEQLDAIVQSLPVSSTSAIPPALAIVPMVLAVHNDNAVTLYHYVQQGNAGALFLSYHRETPDTAPSWDGICSLLANGQTKLNLAWPLLNDDCWYSKWMSEMEVERKFTFQGIPDTWLLINTLYDEMLAGKIEGFVPELDREFQVFDYESHIFEILGPDEERGYISFIPQADGRMTVKRKWFITNSEVRREMVTANHVLPIDKIVSHLGTMTSAPYRKLPAFRRKRFDVNFESLSTGNIYGVYFDICRTWEPTNAFAQCEVEYCRTRTFWDQRKTMEEFELVAAYTSDFLRRQSVAFTLNTYSKLDFVREADAMLG